jgi:DNA helicase-2/ATP-dependent DNA helicase PcrA
MEQGVSMWEVTVGAARAGEMAGDKGLAKKLAVFVEMIDSLALMRTGVSLYDFGREVAVKTGIIGSYRADNSAESISAIENIEELLNSMVGEATVGVEPGDDGEALPLTLEDWLGNVALMTDMDADRGEERNAVTLMTVHSAKGLEFRHVFIVGLEEELFPLVREGDASEVEEERRLFYVALTRAKERSFVSMTETRYIHGKMNFRRPSRFLREIDAQFVEGEVGDGVGGFGGFGGSGGAGAPRSAMQAAERPSAGGWGQSGKPVWESRRAAPQPAASRAAERVAPVTPDARFRKVGQAAPSGGGAQHGVDVTAKAQGPVSPGMRVEHVKFGRGTVNEVEAMIGGGPGDVKITVTFDDPAHGRKTLLSKFAKLQII